MSGTRTRGGRVDAGRCVHCNGETVDAWVCVGCAITWTPQREEQRPWSLRAYRRRRRGDT